MVIEGLLCIYVLLYMLWPLRGFKTIITLLDCRKRFLHFQLNIIFVGSPQFYRHSCQSPSILLICCLLLLLHVLLFSFLTLSVVCGSGSPSQLWLQESLKRCQGLAAFYCECWHVLLLVGEWSRFIFEPKPPFLPGVWPKSPAGWRGAISPLVGEPQVVRCWEVFTLHPAKTKMTGWKILKMGDFPASHVSFQRCTGFNCQCVFLVCNLCKIMLFFSNSGESSQNWPWHWKISPISFFSSMYLCQNNPALKILTPQTWLCWGPGPDLCVIQVRSPFQEGGSDQLFGSSKSWECWDKP